MTLVVEVSLVINQFKNNNNNTILRQSITNNKNEVKMYIKNKKHIT